MLPQIFPAKMRYQIGNDFFQCFSMKWVVVLLFHVGFCTVMIQQFCFLQLCLRVSVCKLILTQRHGGTVIYGDGLIFTHGSAPVFCFEQALQYGFTICEYA
jgi:hypothetical protein